MFHRFSNKYEFVDQTSDFKEISWEYWTDGENVVNTIRMAKIMFVQSMCIVHQTNCLSNDEIVASYYY